MTKHEAVFRVIGELQKTPDLRKMKNGRDYVAVILLVIQGSKKSHLPFIIAGEMAVKLATSDPGTLVQVTGEFENSEYTDRYGNRIKKDFSPRFPEATILSETRREENSETTQDAEITDDLPF